MQRWLKERTVQTLHESDFAIPAHSFMKSGWGRQPTISNAFDGGSQLQLSELYSPLAEACWLPFRR